MRWWSVCVCVCVCERERVRERERVCPPPAPLLQGLLSTDSSHPLLLSKSCYYSQKVEIRCRGPFVLPGSEASRGHSMR